MALKTSANPDVVFNSPERAMTGRMIGAQVTVNNAQTGVSYRHEPDTAVPRDVFDLTNKNPSAAATATGAEDVMGCVYSCQNHRASFPILAMHWGALV